MHFASRTDSGVHATGQVGCFDEETDLQPNQIRKALNYYMTEDVRIRCAQFVQDGPDGFDPRGDACSRSYMYKLNDSQTEPALGRKLITHVRKSLDDTAMNEASQAMVGSHDFAAFAGPSTPPNAPTRRAVESVSVSRNGGEVEFKITANAFLHQQIRRIAGVLYKVGTGKSSTLAIRDFLETAERGAASHVMPAQGLYLESISYEGSGECGLPAITLPSAIRPSVNYRAENP